MPRRTLPDEALTRIFEHIYSSFCTSPRDCEGDEVPHLAPPTFRRLSLVNKRWHKLATPFFLRFVDYHSAPYALKRLQKGASPKDVRFLFLEADSARSQSGLWDQPPASQPLRTQQRGQRAMNETIWPDLVARILPSVRQVAVRNSKEAADAADTDGDNWYTRPLKQLLALRGTPSAFTSLTYLHLSLSHLTTTLDDLLRLPRAAPRLQELYLWVAEILPPTSPDIVGEDPLPCLHSLYITADASPHCFKTHIIPSLILPRAEHLRNLSIAVSAAESTSAASSSSNTSSSRDPSPSADSSDGEAGALDRLSEHFTRPFPRLQWLSFSSDILSADFNAVFDLFPAVIEASLRRAVPLSRSSLPLPAPTLRSLNLGRLTADDLTALFALLHTPSVVRNFASITRLGLDILDFDEEDPAVAEQAQLVIERCNVLGIQVHGSWVQELGEADYEPSSDEDSLAASSVTEADSDGEERQDGSEASLDWDADEGEACRALWSEQRKAQQELDDALTAFRPLQRHFPDYDTYEAAVERAREAFAPYVEGVQE
ncbi:hypothetical protein JCM10213_005376 [Rhodosporidiobolus nylandii]